MGDPRRFQLMADYVAANVTRDARIADVACGKSTLSFLLRRLGYRVTSFEHHPRRGGQVLRLSMRVELFKPEHARDFDVIVGMHPDEATDCIFAGAAKFGARAIVSPCCVRPSAWVYWGSRNSQRQWIDHLVAKSATNGLRVTRGRLKMSGANVLLDGRPS